MGNVTANIKRTDILPRRSKMTRRSPDDGKPVDVQEPIAAQQTTVESTPPDDENLPKGPNDFEDWARDATNTQEHHRSAEEEAEELSSRAESLQVLFSRTGDLSDIQEAVFAWRRAIELTPPDHPLLPARLSWFGVSLRVWFECSDEISSIHEAISVLQNAVELTPSGDSDLPLILRNLGNAFSSRFRRLGDPTDIHQAITVQKKAVELTPAGHPYLPLALGNLGNSLATRYRRLGDLTDIHEAILAQQKSVDLTPLDHPDLPRMLSNLGQSFESRFERLGDLADIHEAIAAEQKAIQLLPPHHPDLPGMLSNLGSSFETRFSRMGDLADIDEAISAHQKSVELTPPSHADVPLRLNNLGNSFQARFDRTGELVDVQEAVSALQKAVKLIPPGHTFLPDILGNLGGSYAARFDKLGDLADIDKAISVEQEAVKLAPPGHSKLPRLLSNLGISFRTRFRRMGDLMDIQEAISAQQKAIKLTPPDHPEYAHILKNVGYSNQKLFEHTKDHVHAMEALDSFRRAANVSTGYPTERLTAARLWARFCTQWDPQQSLTAFDKVMELLPLVAGLEQTMHNRHQNLVYISQVALEAAAAAFSLGEAEKALELLEQGRCIVWTQLNNLRSPLDSLRACNPGLADSILEVSKSLEKAGASLVAQDIDTETAMTKRISSQDDAKERAKLAKELSQLLMSAREIPGFETFFLPTPASTLLEGLPIGGPTIVINVHESRCDALALFSQSRKSIHIPLPNFSYAKATNLRRRMQRGLAHAKLRARASGLEPDGGQEAQSDTAAEVTEHTDQGGSTSRTGGPTPLVFTIKAILRDLWVDVVKPIIDRLGYSPSTLLTTKPRIWWCTTGPLSFLPLHAAGIYGRSDGKSQISDYAISSYTPSVGTLVQRAKNPVVDKGRPGMFMVSQPYTPGLPPIPATTDEVHMIQCQLVDHEVTYVTLEGKDASVEAGMANIEEHSSIHFACHAAQNTTDPLKSRFFFHDGGLELSTIVKANMSHADLAFLSACQTSRGDEKLSEEAVHLAAGMLAAGYRSVVATMWSIADEHAPVIADLFYKKLLACEAQAGRKGINGIWAAYALHHAIQEFRVSLPTTDSLLLIWIPYVHFGL